MKLRYRQLGGYALLVLLLDQLSKFWVLSTIPEHKSVPVIPRYLRREVEERLDYMGNELIPLKREDIRAWVEYFKKEQVESIAVVYLNSYKNDVHERETVAYIKELWPEVYVTGSYQLTNEWREYERTSTTALNAFVQPTAAAYIEKLERELEHEIHHSIAALPAECRQVFLKSRFEIKKYEEIAAELGISVNTVKYHIKNALARLHDSLGKYLACLLAVFLA